MVTYTPPLRSAYDFLGIFRCRISFSLSHILDINPLSGAQQAKLPPFYRLLVQSARLFPAM